MTWYKKYLSVYEQPLQKAPQEVIHEIKTKIEKLQEKGINLSIAMKLKEKLEEKNYKVILLWYQLSLSHTMKKNIYLQIFGR